MKLPFCQTVTLEHPFPISSADRKSMPMTANIKGSFFIPLSDDTACMDYCALLTYIIVLPYHFTIPVITDHLFNGYCIIDPT
jgi:hypothetical protein